MSGTRSGDPAGQARGFLEIADQFKLGDLVTERQHPETTELSELAKEDPRKAFELIRSIDIGVIETLAVRSEQVASLARDMEATLDSGGRIFLSGCGATGRLALTIEWLWRRRAEALSREPDAVVAFMAGGDVAVVKAIEDFEDHPEYGDRQLRELGFRDGDLLVAITEGGETPFVIGTVETAAEISSRCPYFIYCNPDDVLVELVERSRRVLTNDAIRKVNLTTGPQVLSGSTRMQASTIQQLAAGRALFLAAERKSTSTEVRAAAQKLTEFYRELDLSPAADLTVAEADIYRRGEYVIYETDDYPLAVATDTTERAPTFSLTPFENVEDTDPPLSWAYIAIPSAADSAEAWRHLFGREPRALEWPVVQAKAGRGRLLGYDISRGIYDYRATRVGRERLHTFRIYRDGADQVWELDGIDWRLRTGSLDLLDECTVLKILLNTHSTLVMGRLGRYESNIMLYVRPSNYKLIDRTARYVDHLLRRDGVEAKYEDIVHEVFRQLERRSQDESVVWHAYQALTNR